MPTSAITSFAAPVLVVFAEQIDPSIRTGVLSVAKSHVTQCRRDQANVTARCDHLRWLSISEPTCWVVRQKDDQPNPVDSILAQNVVTSPFKTHLLTRPLGRRTVDGPPAHRLA